MDKAFDQWNVVKRRTEKQPVLIHVKEREIYHARLGENVGHEQCGKGEEFVRPVLVVKRLSRELFFAVPLSTTIRQGTFYHTFRFLTGRESCALLVQGKVMSSRRLLNKIGVMKKEEFQALKIRLGSLLIGEEEVTPPPETAGRPEGKL